MACSGLLQSIIDELYNADFIVVAAAGNESTQVGTPANCRNVFPVSATDENDGLALFSNYGSAMKNGVSAPGTNIYTTLLMADDPPYGYVDGTSFSAPIVSAVIGMVWGKKPELKNYDVINILKKTAKDLGDDGVDEKFGWGRVDAYKAISYIEANLSDKNLTHNILVYPNPFSISKDGVVKFHIKNSILYPDDKLLIFDGGGSFVSYVRYDGEKGFIWDGKNDRGEVVAPGIYVVFYKSENGKAKSKFLLMR